MAAQVYDKTRFRIVTPTRADILPVLYFLTQRLFPFNFLVPGQTENTLLPFKSLLARVSRTSGSTPTSCTSTSTSRTARARRATSSAEAGTGCSTSWWTCRSVWTRGCRRPSWIAGERKGRIAFTLVEFQILDAGTAEENEQGENAHARYKQRQKLRVLRRLSRGLVVPRLEDPPGEAE